MTQAIDVTDDLDVTAYRAQRVERATAWILIVCGAIGLIAAFVLTMEKISVLSDPNYTPGCDINPVLSCGSVIVTKQASAFGFPNPFIGLVGYAVVVTLGVLLAAGVILPRWVWVGLNIGAVGGMAFVVWLISQSLYSIGALCPWCMVVWAITIPIFVYVTAANLATGRLGIAPDSGFASAVVLLRNWIAVGIYLIVAGLIFVRWMDFWLGRS